MEISIESLATMGGVTTGTLLFVGMFKRYADVRGLGLLALGAIVAALLSVMGSAVVSQPWPQAVYNALFGWFAAMGVVHGTQTAKEHVGKR